MLQGDSNTDPQNQLELKVSAWTTSINADNSSLKEVHISMVIDSFQGWLFRFFLNFRVELNLSLIEARRKAHNRPVNTFSGLSMPEDV